MNQRSIPLPAARMLTAEQAAAYCGGKTVDWLRAHVRVAPVRIGTRVLYDVRALDRWLDGADKTLPMTADDWLSKLDESDGERS